MVSSVDAEHSTSVLFNIMSPTISSGYELNFGFSFFDSYIVTNAFNKLIRRGMLNFGELSST